MVVVFKQVGVRERRHQGMGRGGVATVRLWGRAIHKALNMCVYACGTARIMRQTSPVETGGATLRA